MIQKCLYGLAAFCCSTPVVVIRAACADRPGAGTNGKACGPFRASLAQRAALNHEPAPRVALAAIQGQQFSAPASRVLSPPRAFLYPQLFSGERDEHARRVLRP